MHSTTRTTKKMRSRKNININNKAQRGGNQNNKYNTPYPTLLPPNSPDLNTKLSGGSPASKLVMRDSELPTVMNDYVTSPRIREKSYDNTLPQFGGSPAYDLVMSNLTSEQKAQQYPDDLKVKGDINSLNLYQTTGGAHKRKNKGKNKAQKNRQSSKNRKSSNSNSNSRKSRNSSNSRKSSMSSNSRSNSRSNSSRKSRSKSRKNNKSHNNSNSKRVQRGGMSAWMSSQYSLGNINAPHSGLSGNFTESSIPSHNSLMNPPNMGLAGSGSPMTALEGGTQSRVGAPY